MNRALVVIDLQNGVCNTPTFFKKSELVTKVNELIGKYREKKLPIIFVQHEDEDLVYKSDEWELLNDLDSRTVDLFVRKTHANSFYKTNLYEILENNFIKELEIVGAQTQYCVDSTIKFAHGLGYKVYSIHFGTSTVDNEFMSAEDTILFYEKIWKDRFIKFK